MGDDPFSGLTDTFQARQQRATLARKQLREQQWRAFGLSIGATALVAAATGVGGASGGWVIEQNASPVRDCFLGGLVCGLVGGVFFFFFALWRVMRRVVIDEVLGDAVQIDIGATLFWAAVTGAILLGSTGATLGLAGRGGWRLDVLACAIGGGVLALVPARQLRNATRHTSRTASGSAPDRKRD
jgi:hypothetical protein